MAVVGFLLVILAISLFIAQDIFYGTGFLGLLLTGGTMQFIYFLTGLYLLYKGAKGFQAKDKEQKSKK